MKKLNNLTRMALTRVSKAACVLLLSAIGSLAAAAGSSEIKMTVSATILKRATLQVVEQPSSVVVTAADVARGYVDVLQTAQLAVKSNSSAGYMLVFSSHSEFVRQTRVRGLGNEVQLGASGGVVPQTGASQGITHASHALGFRFELTESARQGTYPWPVQVSVVPM
jgi:hypothetical protein